MPFRTFDIGVSGVLAQSASLGVTANNLANLSTTGFKSSRANFQDTLYHSLRAATPGSAIGVGVAYGSGVAISSIQPNFNQGPIAQTGQPLDVAINGQGFFVVSDSEGNTYYTRSGAFTTDANGRLTLASGAVAYVIEPPIVIPPGATNIGVAPDGTVSAVVDGSPVVVGQLAAARFINEEGLAQVGNNLFAETGASGAPNLGVFSQNGFGSLVQGSLEGSNVDATAEIIDLITTQSAFSLNVESIRAADREVLTLLAIARQ